MFVVGHSSNCTPEGRAKAMAVLHEAHPGISRTKALARSYVWWPGPGSGGTSELQPDMPAASEITSRGPPSSVGVARAPMGAVTHRLCWTIHGSHVSGSCGCLLQVARSEHNAVTVSITLHRNSPLLEGESFSAMSNSAWLTP